MGTWEMWGSRIGAMSGTTVSMLTLYKCAGWIATKGIVGAVATMLPWAALLFAAAAIVAGVVVIIDRERRPVPAVIGGLIRIIPSLIAISKIWQILGPSALAGQSATLATPIAVPVLFAGVIGGFNAGCFIGRQVDKHLASPKP
jgi:hypothetical protein